MIGVCMESSLECDVYIKQIIKKEKKTKKKKERKKERKKEKEKNLHIYLEYANINHQFLFLNIIQV